jgi:hypothetical protein
MAATSSSATSSTSSGGSDELRSSMQRDINCLSDANRVVRQKAIDRINDIIPSLLTRAKSSPAQVSCLFLLVLARVIIAQSHVT